MRLVVIILALAGCSTARPPSAESPVPTPAPQAAEAPQAPEAPQPDEAPASAPTSTAPAMDPNDIVQPRRVETTPGHAGLVEVLEANGACNDQEPGKPIALLEWSLPNGALYACECEAFAYQSRFELYIADGDYTGPVTSDGNPVTLLGWPSYSPKTGMLTWLTKDRGVGDCGDYYVTKVTGRTLERLEHRRRECDEGASEVPPPSEWPKVE